MQNSTLSKLPKVTSKNLSVFFPPNFFIGKQHQIPIVFSKIRFINDMNEILYVLTEEREKIERVILSVVVILVN